MTQPTVTGVAALVRALTVHQRDLGHDVHVACPAPSELGDWLGATEGVQHHRWQAERTRWHGVPAERRILQDIVDRVRPDVVHLHSSKAGLVGRLVDARRALRVFQPHAWSFLATSGPVGAAALAWERHGAARRTDLLVCGSHAELTGANRQRVVAPQQAVVLNCVDEDRYQPRDTDRYRAARRHLGVEPVEQLVACVGRLCPQKGQDLLLEAWPHVRGRHPDAKLILVGEDQWDLASVVDGDPERYAGIELLGPMSDPRAVYDAADVVVQPSRYETLSLSVLEALAVGCRVVASACPGMEETAVHGGVDLAPAEDAGALARALDAALAAPRQTGAGHWAEPVRATFSTRAWAASVTDVIASKTAPALAP